jgi:uncharacterized protein (DUF433 family)
VRNSSAFDFADSTQAAFQPAITELFSLSESIGQSEPIAFRRSVGRYSRLGFSTAWGYSLLVSETELLNRIRFNPQIFGGKPIVRGRRLAVEHVLGMLEAGDSVEDILKGYPWLERQDVLACIAYARRLIAHERVELLSDATPA